MKLQLIKTIDRKAVELMIERYYEGLTTVDEEKQLNSWLQHPSLAGQFEAERAMLGYFKAEKPVLRLNALYWLRQVAVVALLVVSGVLVIQYMTMPAQASYAYVNGKKITNPEQVRKRAIASLAGLPSSDKLVDNQLKEVSNRELIQSQLDVFAGME